jgi:hypothetical protein
MSRVARLVVGSIALATAAYCLWLVLVGIPTGVADINGSRTTGRTTVPGAIVPLALSALVLVGLGRRSMRLVRVGAVGVLVYGLLAIFGMGVYVPFLGLLLVAATIWYSTAVRREERVDTPRV